jgi:hypothetical protein
VGVQETIRGSAGADTISPLQAHRTWAVNICRRAEAADRTRTKKDEGGARLSIDGLRAHKSEEEPDHCTQNGGAVSTAHRLIE